MRASVFPTRGLTAPAPLPTTRHTSLCLPDPPPTPSTPFPRPHPLLASLGAGAHPLPAVGHSTPLPNALTGAMRPCTAPNLALLLLKSLAPPPSLSPRPCPHQPPTRPLTFNSHPCNVRNRTTLPLLLHRRFKCPLSELLAVAQELYIYDEQKFQLA